MRFKIVWRLLAVLAFLGAVGGNGWAQANGSLVGTVMDKSNAVVPGATITLVNLGTNVTENATSGPSGDYQFLQLLPGTYSVKVEHAGFQQFKVNQVQVEVGVATRVNAIMVIGAATETVEVSTEEPLLNTQSSALNYGVQSSEVQQLPLNGRNPMNLAELVPGVVPQGGSTGNNAATGNVNAWGNYQIGGGTSNQSAEYIDGAPINVSYANSAILVPTQDSIQEFQIATNNISPEYGRFAGGIINMATKSGTNQFHGTAYEYVRNAALNANLYFDKQTNPVTPRPIFTQNQYGATVGGPVLKNKMFFFLAWEQFDLSQASLTSTYVPTAAMYGGDFSAVPTQLYDPNNTTCNSSGLSPGSNPAGTHRCAYTAANGYAGYNQIPNSEINQADVALGKQLWPAPTVASANPATGQINFNSTVPRVTDYNQWTARGDQNLGSSNKLFERFTDWHKNEAGSSAFYNLVGNQGFFGADQAVLGDTVTISPTLLADIRASFLRFVDRSYPFSCCNYNFGSQIGSGWSNLQNEATFDELPEPNVTGMYNFNGAPIILDTDNAYVLSGAFTKILGRHTITFGGEMRKIEWDYAQSNSPGSTFNFPSGEGYTSSSPTDKTTGFGFASWMVGDPSLASTSEPALSKGVMWYSGLYVSDSFRWTPKLTVNAGVRWEQPGSFTETHGRLTTLLMNLPQPTVTAAMNAGGYSGTYMGGLGLINSSAYPHNDWQELHWDLFSPRVGFAYSPTSMWVVKGGFGITYLPPTVAFSLGPYNDPLNLAVTNNTSTSLIPSISMSNPFPNGITTPPVGSSALQADINSLLGQGIQSPLPNQTYPYEMQWNVGVQRQFGNSASLYVNYAGARGNHLPLYSVNEDQLPDQYDADAGTGNAQDPTVVVTNPLSSLNGGPIPSTTPVLGPATIMRGYLEKPNPQYQWMTADSPDIGFSFYEALQVLAQKRFKNTGILSAAYTLSNFVGTADVLTGWLEESRYDVGGAEGVQDNTNIRGNSTNPGEYSRSTFQVPNLLVVNYVYPLPFGHGMRYLSSATGVLDKVVDGWTVNGITTFRSGFPLAFQDSSPNELESDFAAGNAGPGLGAGVSRPNFVAGCHPQVNKKPSDKLNAWFNTACYQQPGEFQFGNEPRVDPYLRSQGIDNTDFSFAKDIALSDRYRLDFRAEFFNIFNWTQFDVPNDESDDATQFGKVTAQYNQPRLLQLSGRFSF